MKYINALKDKHIVIMSRGSQVEFYPKSIDPAQENNWCYISWIGRTKELEVKTPKDMGELPPGVDVESCGQTYRNVSGSILSC